MSLYRTFTSNTFAESHAVQGIMIYDRYFSVPLCYSKKVGVVIECRCKDLKSLNAKIIMPKSSSENPPDGLPCTYKVDEDCIRLFVRHLVPLESVEKSSELPFLIYFQGGPGFESPEVINRSGWFKAALEHYQIILLDQRGTGLSFPLTAQSFISLETAKEKADYLSLFRTENIVQDAEEIRKLISSISGKDVKWNVLGQSFGGFCTVHYMSTYPDSLNEIFITGGMPPIYSNAKDVYLEMFKRVAQMNENYYQRYPEDIERVKNIVKFINSHEPISLPNGGALTTRRFQQLGLVLGVNGGLEKLHYLLQYAFENFIKSNENHVALSYRFLHLIQTMVPFDTNPIYSLLHESIYCQGVASNWAASAVLKDIYDSSNFNWKFVSQHKETPLYFLGEMIFPWMFEDYAQLKPLKEVADVLASKSDWCQLYDDKVLSGRTFKCVAAVYFDDMYVDLNLSLKTAKIIGGCQTWISNEFHHSAIRDHGYLIMTKLIKMIKSGGNI